MRRKERGYDNKWLAGKGEGGLAAGQSSDPRTFLADYKARIFVYNVSLFFFADPLRRLARGVRRVGGGLLPSDPPAGMVREDRTSAGAAAE